MLWVVDMPFDLALRYRAGIVTRAQAHGVGLSDDAIAHRVATGRWQRVHLGVYATFSGPLSRQARLWAAVLYAGGGAVLSHETAAELQRLLDKPAPLIHLTVPEARRVAPQEGLRIHLSRQAAADQRFPPGVLPQTFVEDTILDLVDQAETVDEVCALITRAFGRRLTGEGTLRAAMRLHKRLRWRSDVDVLITEAARGTHSLLEYHYDRDVEGAHGLPKSARQAPYPSLTAARAFVTGSTGNTGCSSNWTARPRTLKRTGGPTANVTTTLLLSEGRPSASAGSTCGTRRAAPRP